MIPLDTGQRRTDIQGLRAIAVVLVVLYHAGIGPDGGFIGVDVFFVISGYVIAASLFREHRANGAIDLRSFYSRRIARLLPAFALVVSTTLLLTPLLASHATRDDTLRTAIGGTLLNANTVLTLAGTDYYASDSELNPLLHIWSLSVEEQFYLVAPLSFALMWRVSRRLGRRRARTVIAIAGVAMAASLALTLGRDIWVDALGVGPVRSARLTFYSMPARAWQFLAGGLLAIAHLRANLFRHLQHHLTTAVGLLLILVLSFAAKGTDSYPGLDAVAVVGATLLVLHGGMVRSHNGAQRLLELKAMQLVGDWSYSWYLWHWPLIVFASAAFPSSRFAGPAGAVLSLVAAHVTYRIVESPLRYRWRSKTSTAPLAFAGFASPLLAVALTASISTVITAPDFEAATQPHISATAECDNRSPIGERDLDECAWGATGSDRSAVLIGDSNASHLSEGFVAAAKAADYRAIVAVSSGCPFRPLDIRRPSSPGFADNCSRFVTESLGFLVANPPDIVIISSSEGYLTGDEYEMFNDAGLALGVGAERVAQWATSTFELITRLEEVGTHVVLVGPVAKGVVDPQACSALLWLIGARMCSGSLPVEEARARAASQTGADMVQVSRTSALFLDPMIYLCSGNTCPAILDGTYLYSDNTHISVEASEMLATMFAKAFE